MKSVYNFCQFLRRPLICLLIGFASTTLPKDLAVYLNLEERAKSAAKLHHTATVRCIHSALALGSVPLGRTMMRGCESMISSGVDALFPGVPM